jgi:hypothetical protein
MSQILEGTWGFVTWKDVTSDNIEGGNATFYYLPSQPTQGWAGNGQRLEVKSFRSGRVSSARDKSAKVFVEYVPRGARKTRAAVERSNPSLVILEGWTHPNPPSGWVSNGGGMFKAKWPLFAPEWQTEMEVFLSDYRREHPNVRVLADFRDGTKSPMSPQLSTTAGHELFSAVSDKLTPVVDAASFVSADEVKFNGRLIEGAVKSVLVNAYERNREARRRCIEHYGPVCCVCDFDFGGVYGSAVSGYIHVHHLKALSEIVTEYVVDPIADLRPVCPNCHAVIHSREPQFTINEVREMLAVSRQKNEMVVTSPKLRSQSLVDKTKL